MSVKVSAVVWQHYPNGGGEFLTALCLAEHADPDGTNIYPGIRRVAELTQQSERTIQRHIGIMLTIGWLVKTQDGGTAPGVYTAYRMPIEAIPLGVEGRVTKLHPSSYPHGCHPKQKGVTNAAKRGDNGNTTYTHCLPALKPRVDRNRRSTPKPLQDQSDGELITKAMTLGIQTRGLKRDELVRAIERKTQ